LQNEHKADASNAYLCTIKFRYKRSRCICCWRQSTQLRSQQQSDDDTGQLFQWTTGDISLH